MKPSVNIYLADPILNDDKQYLLDRSYRLFDVNYPDFKEIYREILNIESKTDVVSAIVIRSYRTINSPEITLLKKTSVKLICTLSSGYDNIDINACRKARISVINIADGNYISAAEHAFALILALSKNIIRYNSDVSAGNFKSEINNNFELMGKTIGIIGVGRVGSLVAKYARSFDMKILGNDINKKLVKKFRYIKFVSLDTIFRNSDIITIHVPLNDSTIGLVKDSHFNLIREKCLFINTSRGEVVDEDALIHAIESRKLAGAGLDVFKNEPNLNSKLRDFENVILTPHVAGKTPESKMRISKIAVKNIHRFFENGLKGIV